jgi:hypothetical protein
MTHRTQEILDFARMEPDSADDIAAMVKDCDPEELAFLDKVSGHVANAVRSVKARRQIKLDSRAKETVDA